MTPERFRQAAASFAAARSRISVAEYFETMALREAIQTGHEAGMSIREVARALRVPRSTVHRHWNGWSSASPSLPMWGDPAVYAEMASAILGDDFDGQVPFEWTESGDGTRQVSSIPAGYLAAATSEQAPG